MRQGAELNVDIANEISAGDHPNLGHPPGRHTYIEELNEAGGIYAGYERDIKAGLLNSLTV